MLVVTVEGSSPSRPAEPASTTPLTTHLVVVEDDDDIDWNVYNFENSESAEELIALIQVAGPPRRIEGLVLRILRHLHHIGTTLSSQGVVYGARHRPFEARNPAQSTPTTTPFVRKASSHLLSD